MPGLTDETPARPILPTKPAPSVFDGIGGFVRSLTSFTPDHAEGRALLEAAHSTGRSLWIAGQLAVGAKNDQDWPKWAQQWERAGAVVPYWWRVNHTTSNSPPGPGSVLQIPNAEEQPEHDRLPAILPFDPAAICAPGKAGGIDVGLLESRRQWVLAECFREKPESDHTITNSHQWWNDMGFDTSRWTASIQLYGAPFSSPADQAREALSVGSRGVWLYPLDGADPGAIRQVAEVIG